MPAFVATKEGTFPVPAVGPNPIGSGVLVHEKVAPAVGLEKTVAGTVFPAQKVLFGTGFTVGFGLMVIVNVVGGPVHLTPLFSNVAVTVKVDVKGVLPELVAVNEGTFPEPAVGTKPIDSGVLVQEKVDPGTLLVNTVSGTVAPAQKVRFGTGFTVGFGLMVIVN